MVIFHKTEIHTFILRCLTSLNLNWYKSYDTKRKNSKNANLCFWTKLQKNGNGNISVLSHNFWTNKNLLEFRPVKHVKMFVWTSVFWKIYMPKNWLEMVVKLQFSCLKFWRPPSMYEYQGQLDYGISSYGVNHQLLKFI